MSQKARRLWREARHWLGRMPRLRTPRLPEAPLITLRDPWPGDAALASRLLRGEGGAVWQAEAPSAPLTPQSLRDPQLPAESRAELLAFGWIRHLRALGNDAARLTVRALTASLFDLSLRDPVASRPDVAGRRLAAWLGHWDFFAASADEAFRYRLMERMVEEARWLSHDIPGGGVESAGFAPYKGILAAAVALPEVNGLLAVALRHLPGEILRQVASDGTHLARSPYAQLRALQDLIEIRALLQAAQIVPPAALTPAIERMSAALRTMRMGDGGLAAFNGTLSVAPELIELVLAQAGRNGRAPAALPEGRFYRLSSRRSCVVVDAGPLAPGFGERFGHAGALSFEFSVGRSRVVVNCGAAPPTRRSWFEALRTPAAHSTLSLLTPEEEGGALPFARTVTVDHQEQDGAHWLEAVHDGWEPRFGLRHRRRLYLAEDGEDLRGEDLLEGGEAVPFLLRFHLHPDVAVDLEESGQARLAVPDGGEWVFRTDAPLSVEESVYLGRGEPEATLQLVLRPEAGGALVRWAFGRR